MSQARKRVSKISAQDVERIQQISARTWAWIDAKNGRDSAGDDPYRFVPSLALCHKAHPLRLEDLLRTDDFNLLHDVLGIAQNMNHEHGVLEKNFLPRFRVRPPVVQAKSATAGYLAKSKAKPAKAAKKKLVPKGPKLIMLYVVENAWNKVVRTLGPMSERKAEKVLAGLLRQMDTDRFHVTEADVTPPHKKA